MRRTTVDCQLLSLPMGSKPLTDVTPNRRPVDSVVPPYHAVDKLHQVDGPDPCDVQDASHIPGWAEASARAARQVPQGGLTFQMPVKRNRYETERDEGEGGEERLLSLPGYHPSVCTAGDAGRDRPHEARACRGEEWRRRRATLKPRGDIYCGVACFPFMPPFGGPLVPARAMSRME